MACRDQVVARKSRAARRKATLVESDLQLRHRDRRKSGRRRRSQNETGNVAGGHRRLAASRTAPNCRAQHNASSRHEQRKRAAWSPEAASEPIRQRRSTAILSAVGAEVVKQDPGSGVSSRTSGMSATRVVMRWRAQTPKPLVGLLQRAAVVRALQWSRDGGRPRRAAPAGVSRSQVPVEEAEAASSDSGVRSRKFRSPAPSFAAARYRRRRSRKPEFAATSRSSPRWPGESGTPRRGAHSGAMKRRPRIELNGVAPREAIRRKRPDEHPRRRVKPKCGGRTQTRRPLI